MAICGPVAARVAAAEQRVDVVGDLDGLSRWRSRVTADPTGGCRAPLSVLQTENGEAFGSQARTNGRQLRCDSPSVGLQNGGGIRNNSLMPAGSVTELDTCKIGAFCELRQRRVEHPAGAVQGDPRGRGFHTPLAYGRFAQVAPVLASSATSPLRGMSETGATSATKTREPRTTRA